MKITDRGHRWIKASVWGLMAAHLACSIAAWAQTPVTTGNEFVTNQPGKTVPGVVFMCIDVNGYAIPAVNSGNCSGGGGGGGGLSVVDRASWTQGTSPFTPSGGVFNDAATLTSGQQGTARLTTKRASIVDVDTSGNALYSALTAALPAGSNNIGSVNALPPAGTSTVTTAAPTALTFASVLAASATRKSCTIQNTGLTMAYFFTGANASATTSNSFQVASGGSFQCQTPTSVLTDNISATCASGTCAFVISAQ